MSSTTAQATFAISVEGNAPDAMRDVSASSREAYDAITKYEGEIKSLSSELRRLRGNSEEVTAAKKQIRDRIDTTRSAVSSLSTSLLKQGSSYGSVAEALKREGTEKKKSTDETNRFALALGIVSPRLSAAHGLIQNVTKASAGAEGGLSGMRLASLGAAAGVAAIAAAAAAAAVGIGALIAGTIRFALVSSAAADRAQRQRQAILGSAEDAKALGTQIDALAGKVATPKEEIQALGVELSRTRLSGKAIVDTMAAVTQASAAAGDTAGSKLKEIVTRGQAMGRIGIGLFELQGTGLNVDDVAAEYAASTKKSVSLARAELLQGRAGIEAGAAALSAAATKKFGTMNLAGAFDLENAPKKLGEQLALLGTGVDFAPLSKGLAGLYAQLDPRAPLGSAVHTLVTTLGQGFVDIASRAIPQLVEGFKWMVVGGLKIMTTFYEVKNSIYSALDPKSGVSLGRALISGIAKGLLESEIITTEAMKKVAGSVLHAFKDALEIRSPSRKFAGAGRELPRGLAQGVEAEAPRARRAVAEMIRVPMLAARPIPANDVFAGATRRGIEQARAVPGAESARAPAPSAAPVTTVSNAGDTTIVNIYAGNASAKDFTDPGVLAGITQAVRAARNAQAAGRAA